MTEPLLTDPVPLLVMAIKELLSGPPAEIALRPEYLEKLKVLEKHPGTKEIALSLMRIGNENEDADNS